MEDPDPAGSPREEKAEEKRGAGPGWEADPQEPGHPPSRSSLDTALDWVAVRHPSLLSRFLEAKLFWISWLFPQAFASHPSFFPFCCPLAAMEFPIPAGSPREEKEEEKGGAGPRREDLPQDPGHAPSRFSWGTPLHWIATRHPNLLSRVLEAAPSLRSWFPAPMESASSPPMPQAHAGQENTPPNEENPQPNEQPQEDFVMLKDFTIQVHVTGRTGDCEKDFLEEVHDRLLKHEICLKREDYREDSNHFLLVFCPVASRVGTDMQNATEGLQGEPKAILVMLHHRPKEYDRFLDTKLQAQHLAVVHTVHARYTLEDGLYDCQVNEEAVAAVAEVLKDHLKKEQDKPPTPDLLKEEPEKPSTPDSGDHMCSSSAQESND